MIEVIITSPFKDVFNEKIESKPENKTNKTLRTPSSKKKENLKKKNDLLPSVSPLLKKLLAKEETTSKSNVSSTKDPLNVALFYDEMWDSSK